MQKLQWFFNKYAEILEKNFCICKFFLDFLQNMQKPNLFFLMQMQKCKILIVEKLVKLLPKSFNIFVFECYSQSWFIVFLIFLIKIHAKIDFFMIKNKYKKLIYFNC